LLHETNRNGWALWFQAAGLPDLASTTGPIYADAAHAIQAAKLGHGVALGDRVMESDDLRLGNFVRPFEIDVPYGDYWLVASDFRCLSRPANAFAEWITEELGAEKKS
jgi:LysR family transcriptional regulator, glycine cleavage system transcriptional activator